MGHDILLDNLPDKAQDQVRFMSNGQIGHIQLCWADKTYNMYNTCLNWEGTVYEAFYRKVHKTISTWTQRAAV